MNIFSVLKTRTDIVCIRYLMYTYRRSGIDELPSPVVFPFLAAARMTDTWDPIIIPLADVS